MKMQKVVTAALEATLLTSKDKKWYIVWNNLIPNLWQNWFESRKDRTDRHSVGCYHATSRKVEIFQSQISEWNNLEGLCRRCRRWKAVLRLDWLLLLLSRQAADSKLESWRRSYDRFGCTAKRRPIRARRNRCRLGSTKFLKLDFKKNFRSEYKTCSSLWISQEKRYQNMREMMLNC